MKKLKVSFVDSTNTVAPEYYPKPAKAEIPDWYKKASSHIDNFKQAYVDNRGFSSATIKKCMPVYDSLTAGYILYTPVDVQVTNDDGGKYFKWPEKDMISFHNAKQVPNHPAAPGSKNPFPKWNNPWIVKTPPGYSSLFVSPMHRESVFQLFEGVVDTDTYLQAVQFPFLFKDQDFHGIIPAGTPMAQVIPFKRDAFVHETILKSDLGDNLIEQNYARLKATFFNGYKDRFWHRKEFN
jgi:hypothetical protein